MTAKRPRGQSTAEYAVVIGVVVAALVAMQVYVKRGLQAKMKGVADHFANTAVGGQKTKQYEPYYVSSSHPEVTQERQALEEVSEGGLVKRSGIIETTTRKGGSSTTRAAPK